jgi:GntR family transcriptional regulator, hexuronate regulon transcriptional repressor
MARLAAAGIAKSLKARIDSGEWSDGSKMPPERELAESFGVARNTIRRAIGMLSVSVPISREVGRGTFFESNGHTSISEIIVRMEGSSPADMMEIRQLLEPTAAAFAATNASAGELAMVAEAHERASQATEMPDFEHWDAELHHRIFACSRNELLREMHNILRVLRNQNPWFEMKKRSFSQERRENYCREHEAFVDALLRRDPDAARTAMQKHLRSVESNILGR